MKHIPYFKKFLTDEVNLNKSRLDRLAGHETAVKKFLKDNLNGYEDMDRQGSYGLKTIIKPVKDGQEYDADLILFMKHDPDKEPKQYIEDVYACFRSSGTYKDMVHRRTRCVELDYAGDVHIDLVPCVERWGGMYICNRKDNIFEITDGTGYRDWFNERSRNTNGNLKRVVRLLKYLRDHKGNFSVKSILLTTLVGRAEEQALGGAFGSVPDALNTIVDRINTYLQDHPVMPEIPNPVLPGENFNRHWDQKKYENFRDKFDKITRKIADAIECTDHDESVDKWRELFGDKFGEKKGNGSRTAGGAAAIVPGVVSIVPPRPYAP